MIRDALLLQKEELINKFKQRYINRNVKIKNIKKDIIKIIIGPRRAGKSSFVIHELSSSENFGYVNFDDEVLSKTNDYNDIINQINLIYNKPKYILFDEVQNIPKWELLVNRLQRQGYNLIITGSNSNLLSSELSTHLTGRFVQTDITTFSFKEFLSYETQELTDSEVKAKFSDYLKKGGYPEPLVKELDYSEYLSTLFDSIIYKDIVKRYKVRNFKEIDELAIYLISNSSKEFSYNNLAKMTGNKSDITIKKYISYLKEAYIFFEISKYSWKVKEQIKSNKKIYCTDNGFITAKGFRTSEDTGRLYENITAIELKRRSRESGFEIYYWKNQQQEEVDFILKSGTKIKQIIQVCSSIKMESTKNRETRALIKCSKELKCSNLLVLTGNYESIESLEWFGIKRRIKFIPLWKWLLE